MSRYILIAVALGLLVFSFVPFWFDPYEHKIGVDFWTWASREIEELRQGEKS